MHSKIVKVNFCTSLVFDTISILRNYVYILIIVRIPGARTYRIKNRDMFCKQNSF